MVKIKRSEGKIIPFEYNYYLSIAVYSKLKLYENEVKLLHSSKQPGFHTISNIIPRKPIKSGYGINGVDIPEGFFIVRSLDKLLTLYLRLGITIEPEVRIGDVIYSVTGVNSLQEPSWNKEELKFKTLSPVIIRNFSDKKLFVDTPDQVEDNLNLVTRWGLKQYYGFREENLRTFKINLTKIKKKTVKISNSKKKESITSGFEFVGNISGPIESLKTLYYKGFGSKTSLGLGCWEVV